MVCWQAQSLPSSAAAIAVGGPGEDGEPDVVGPPAARAARRCRPAPCTYSHYQMYSVISAVSPTACSRRKGPQGWLGKLD